MDCSEQSVPGNVEQGEQAAPEKRLLQSCRTPGSKYPGW